jgi:soluble lytic murein transglycosylase-like protein
VSPIRLSLPFALIALLSLASCQPPPDVSKAPDDALLTLYRDEHLRPLVVEYYAQLTSDRPVALAILETCDELNLDPSLAFSMAWNESKFNPRAVNYNPTTIDRGLFQLNSRTFSRLSRKTVFDPRSNAQQGLAFYKNAFDRLRSEEKALGYYNSGIGLLTDRTLPRSTQAYVKKVLADRERMDRDAIAFIYFSHDARLALR